MKTYAVTITKQGTIVIEAESEEHAEQIARNQEADGCFWMDLIVEVVETKL